MARHEYVHGKDSQREDNKKETCDCAPFYSRRHTRGLAKIQNVNLCVDIFYFLGLFMHTICKGIRYVTAEPLPNEDEATLKKALDKVCKIFESRGFKVAVINADQFECLKGKMRCGVECVAKGEHQPDVERSTRTQEEHTRTVVQRVPFLKFPIVMAESAAIAPCLYRNFPNK
ncbi:hypothetical protein CTEN210_09794 [Chaetoceros tenuissimus]|uniref:Uncharacterized protein n=1 Tax=Chaetoceros tenuissimus TaxID=426638 RepID=A0AAD3CWA2_9STRA|nr:hypothetical protein CTEN210_09794 [Chaetoceros tenuissimus]